MYNIWFSIHLHPKSIIISERLFAGRLQAFLRAWKLPDSTTGTSDLYVPNIIRRTLSETRSTGTSRHVAESDAVLLQQIEINPLISHPSMPFSRQREVLQAFLAAGSRSISGHSMR